MASAVRAAISSARIRSEEVVVLCSLAGRTAEQQDRLRWLVESEIHWSRIWETAAFNQVLPLVAKTLISLELSASLPTSVVQYAKAVRLRTVFFNMSAREELARIAGVMAAQRIPCVPLKGTHLAERLLKGIDSRQLGDIDILVPEPELESARSVLSQVGYSPAASVPTRVEEHSFHATPYVRRGPTGSYVAELHWRLNDPRFVSINHEQLWLRILASSDSDQILRPLPSEELLLFLALHQAKHAIGVLRLLVDIDRLVRLEGDTLDWPFVVMLAGRWSVSSMLYFALRHSQFLLRTPVPLWVLEQLKPAQWRRVLVDLLLPFRSLVRPTRQWSAQSVRFQIAYAAMLGSFGRAVHAYCCYLFPPASVARPGLLWKALGTLKRLSSGVTWTGLALIRSLADRLLDGWAKSPERAP